MKYHAPMRVIHLVAADRWTGAAATALQAVEALRAEGIEAHFAFRPGRNLQERLAGLPWAHPILEKERSPQVVRRVLENLSRLLADFSIVHVHLPHDHLLAWWVLRRGPGSSRLFRSVHHPKHLRPDPYHRFLFRSLAGVGLANGDMEPLARRLAPQRPMVTLPLALEPRFAPLPHRQAIRQALGIPPQAFVAGTVGKLDAGRGQDLLLHALSTLPQAWGLVVGKGPALPKLQRLAQKLGVACRVVFPGYREEGLEELYAAMDVFVFPEPGSDWAHRAVAEAAACGVPTLAVDVPGIRDRLVPGLSGDLWPRGDAAALAVLLARWAGDEKLRQKAGEKARELASVLTPQALALALHKLYGAR
jgi:glycosyltransferase involved in cell wall biosynthesis